MADVTKHLGPDHPRMGWAQEALGDVLWALHRVGAWAHAQLLQSGRAAALPNAESARVLSQGSAADQRARTALTLALALEELGVDPRFCLLALEALGVSALQEKGEARALLRRLNQNRRCLPPRRDGSVR